jgi:ABC-type Fe3+ transport system substrate-binding protein
MADEFKAGVRHFDLHIGGSSIVPACWTGILDPIRRGCSQADPKQWWAVICRSITQDGSFMFQRICRIIWYNTDLVKPNEIRSYDDFLNPKWKGKIGYLDPRTPGAGESTWAFMWQIKGEEYLKKLVAQDLFLGRDQRVSENLAKEPS